MRWVALSCLLIAGCLFWDVGGKPPERKCGERGATPDGYHCSCDRDCSHHADGAFCDAEYESGSPNGECVHRCDQDNECDDGYVCAFNYCQPLCATRDDCESGRICWFYEELSAAICEPRCDRHADCDSGSCNLYSGKCNRYGERPRGAGLNAHCRDPEDCRSAVCSTRSHRCLSFCDQDYQRCPDEGICLGGVCRNSCGQPDDCSSTQSCLESEHGPYCGIE